MACCENCEYGLPCRGKPACSNAYNLGPAVSRPQLNGLVMPAGSYQATAGSSVPQTTTVLNPTPAELCQKYGTLPGMSYLCNQPGTTGGEGTSMPSVGVVTEQQCQAREAAAYSRGVSDERSSIVIPTVIGAFASTLTGALVGWAISKAAG